MNGYKSSTKQGEIRRQDDALAIKGGIPGEGARRGELLAVAVTAAFPSRREPITLTGKLGVGGEGSVFSTSKRGYVAKVYHRERLTEGCKEKLKAMISKPIDHPGICFPEALLLNEQGEFVGYLMKEASGQVMSKSVFMPKKAFQMKFPGWTKRETVRLCITILEMVKKLNDAGIIIGDINPSNILVESPEKVYFVDCDSYQVAGFPCPVGTSHFTAPEIQGLDFKGFLRTQQNENFAVAVLLFMIMMPGKSPYSFVGGESPAKNIALGNFPYSYDSDAEGTPPGVWGYIWDNLSFDVKRAFQQSFKRGAAHYAPEVRITVDGWLAIFRKYLGDIDLMERRDPMATEVFPTRRKLRKKKCKHAGCGREYMVDPDNYTPFCELHRNEHQVARSTPPTSGLKEHAKPAAGRPSSDQTARQSSHARVSKDQSPQNLTQPSPKAGAKKPRTWAKLKLSAVAAGAFLLLAAITGVDAFGMRVCAVCALFIVGLGFAYSL